ncbi:VOC family protein [Natrinema sp. J7-1]|uniref:VOC family protein n=1 Tax=Natrinema sp. J7-1 TaxID=1172566 RepID=UPI000677B1BA|nr:VOC family protein [Natrinema sp. J7-1]
MSDDHSTPVPAELPDSPVHTTGTDHITIWGSNEQETVEFYQDVLGMPLVLPQPNLDDPSQTHLFFDTGDGRILTFFVSDARPSNQRGQRGGVGAVHHLCFSIDPDEYEDTMQALEDAGHQYNVFDRGIFHSIYTTDNNGLVIELSADKYEIPDARRGDVLAMAQKRREADGAEYAKDEHLRDAIDALGLEVIEYDLPEASSGVGGVE